MKSIGATIAERMVQDLLVLGLHHLPRKRTVMAGVDQFLQSMQAEGAKESAGTFTVDPHRALEKLAKFQLSGPGWIPLKLVQVAVCCGAPFVVISLRRNDFLLTFPFPPGQGLEEFSLDQEDQGPWQRHLKIALRAANQSQAWSLQLNGPSRNFRVAYDGEQIEQAVIGGVKGIALGPLLNLLPKRLRRSLVDLTTKDDNLAVFQLSRDEKWWRKLLRLPAREHAELVARLRLCPVPILLDRFLINSPWEFPKSRAKCYTLTAGGGHSLLGPPCEAGSTRVYRLPWRMVELGGGFQECLLARWSGVVKGTDDKLEADRKLPIKEDSYVVTPEGSAFNVPAVGPQWRWDSRGHHRAWLCSQTIQIAENSRRKSLLIPVVHGVSLDPVSLPESLPRGTVAACLAHDLKVDLSEKTVVQNADLEKRVEDVCGSIESLLKEAQAAEHLYT